MTEQRQPESQLRFLTIVTDPDSQNPRTDLYTPDAHYVISRGVVVKSRPIGDYEKTIEEALNNIARRARVAHGFFSGNYRIHFQGKSPEPKLS